MLLVADSSPGRGMFQALPPWYLVLRRRFLGFYGYSWVQGLGIRSVIAAAKLEEIARSMVSDMDRSAKLSRSGAERCEVSTSATVVRPSSSNLNPTPKLHPFSETYLRLSPQNHTPREQPKNQTLTCYTLNPTGLDKCHGSISMLAGHHIGALIIRTGFWGPLYYNYTIRNPQDSIGNY